MANNDDELLLNPDAVPGGTGVRRVNKLPLAIVGVVVLLAVLGFMYGIHKTSQRQAAQREAADTDVFDTRDTVMGILADETDGMIGKDPEMETVVLDRDGGGRNGSNTHTRDEIDPAVLEELMRMRRAMAQQLSEANTSSTTVNVGTLYRRRDVPNASGGAGGGQEREVDPRIAGVQGQIDAARGRLENALGSLENQGRGATVSPDVPNRVGAGQSIEEAYANRRSDGSVLVEFVKQDPASGLEVKAGTVVPAMLITGVNSDLPGQMIAQVSQDIWDTRTGRYLLIPQGSRLIGQYDSNNAYGVERVGVVWSRIMWPDGTSMTLGGEGMAGGDREGYAGFQDKVNNHYFRIFGTAALMSLTNVGIEIAREEAQEEDDRFTRGQDVLARDLGNVLRQVMQKNLNIQPTIEIRPGYRFAVIVSRDLAFEHDYYDRRWVPSDGGEHLGTGFRSQGWQPRSPSYSRPYGNRTRTR